MRQTWLELSMALLAALLVAACSAEQRASNDAAGGCGAVAEPNAWASWVMPNPVQGGLPNPASYTVSASQNETTDDVTGLVWQRNLGSGELTWAEARQYCACLTIDETSGFRLPSRIELASIADWTRSAPALDSNAFPDTPSESFWSSSVLNGNAQLGFQVDFDSSHTTYSDEAYGYRVRCVRGGASAQAVRYVVESGTVFDKQTKLTWQQASPDESYTWGDATSYCGALSLNGGGWRLPTVGELQTVVDEATNPSIDGATFPGTPSEYFWSSSLVATDPARAWTCFFANGSTYSFFITTERNVRCVR